MANDGATAAPDGEEDWRGDRPTVVVFRLGSLGDTVVAVPGFHAIARRFPEHRRLVLTNAPVATNAAPLLAVLGVGDLVHGAIAYPVGLRRPSELLALRRTLRSTGADTLVYLAPSRSAAGVLRDWLFFKLCGFRTILGTPWTRDRRECRIDPATGLMEREASRLARNMEAGVGPVRLEEADSWNLKLTHAEKARAEQALAPLSNGAFICVNMGGKVAINDWGEANWTALARSLSQTRPDLGLVSLGAGEDHDRAGRLASIWSGRTVNLCGKLAPRESAAVLERATLFIGHDSGPLHLAAASQTPSIGLFGENNPPAKWHPYGLHVRAIHNMAGVTEITVADVVAASEDMLSRFGDARATGS